MAVLFLDSSALVKRYISEIGSTWILELFNPVFNNEVFVAALSEGLVVENPNHHPQHSSTSARTTSSYKKICT